MLTSTRVNSCLGGLPSASLVITHALPDLLSSTATNTPAGYLGNEDFFGCISSGLVKRHEELVLALHAQVCAPSATPALMWLYGELFGGNYAGQLALVFDCATLRALLDCFHGLGLDSPAGTIAVQAGVCYSPRLCFAAFDIAVSCALPGRSPECQQGRCCSASHSFPNDVP